jgi:tetratricopeptide (TPR) repeat protein
LGAFKVAAESMEGVIARAKARQIVLTQIMAGRVLALALVALGRGGDARAAASRAVELATGGTNRLHAGNARNALARACLVDGELGLAKEQAEAAKEETPAATVHVDSEALLAEIHLAGGRPAEALEAAQRALALLESKVAIGHGEAAIRLVHARTLHATGDVAGARSAIDKACERLRTRATASPDEAVREAFLSDVPENAKTFALAREWG